MPNCKFCNQEGLDWYQDSQEKWKLGIKLDINNYRQHKCNTKEPEKKTSNSRNWIKFNCKKCDNEVRLNVKLYKELYPQKDINLCSECERYEI